MIQGLYAITPSGLEENDLLTKTEVLLKEGIKLIKKELLQKNKIWGRLGY